MREYCAKCSKWLEPRCFPEVGVISWFGKICSLCILQHEVQREQEQKRWDEEMEKLTKEPTP